MFWQYKLNSKRNQSLVYLTSTNTSSSSKSTSSSTITTTETNSGCNIIKERQRPVWLHLIAIFFSKRMLYAAVQYGISVGVMIHYHARLGFHLLLLAACMEHV